MFLRAVVLLTCACGDDAIELPGCTGVEPASAVIVASTTEATIHDVVDNGEVELIAAPQGGHILLVGARIAAADERCQLIATGALRDPQTRRVIGVEQRPLLLERHPEGWLSPRAGLDAMPNVAVCPSAAAMVSIDGNLYTLEIELSSTTGAPLASLAATIQPTCSSEFCRAECAPLP
jgi:hypothetical protein